MGTNERFEQCLNLMAAGDYESARRGFHALAAEAQEPQTKSEFLLGELVSLVRLGRTADARSLLDESRPLFQEVNEARARGDLIEVQLDSLEDHWEPVLPALERMLREYADILSHSQLRDVYEEVQLRRGMRPAHLQRYREALPVLEEVLDFNPALLSAEYYYELGRSYMDGQALDQAYRALTKATQLGLDDSWAASAHWHLGGILLRRGNYEQALNELRLAEKHADIAGSSKKNIFKALAVACKKLGMDADSARYYAKIHGSA